MRRPLIWASLAAAMSTALASAGGGSDLTYIYVDDDAPEGGDGSTWQTAFRDLQDALDAARCLDPVEIRVADGTYVPSGANGTARDRFLVDALRGGCGITLDPPDFGVAPDESPRFYADDASRSHPNLSHIVFSIRGAFAGLTRPDNPDLQDPTEFTSILSGDRNGDDLPSFRHRGDNCRRVLEIHSRLDDATLLVEHLTVRGGNATISANRSGAGIYISASSGIVSLNECLVTDNEADERGGGLLISEAFWVQLYRSSFIGNQAQSGGAVYTDAFLQTHHSLFESNRAYVDGGAIAARYQTLTSNTIFADNAADLGGAIHSTEYGPFFGCLFVENSAGCASVAAFPWNSMTNCTIIQSGESTPAVVFDYGGGFINCVLVRAGTSPIAALGSNGAVLGVQASLIDDDAQAFDLNGGELVWIESLVDQPHFLDPFGPDGLASTWQDNDYRPGPGSAMIDAGHSDRTGHCRQGETDPAGNLRILDAWNYENTGVPCRHGVSVIDIGAFEAPADTPRLCIADWNADETVDVNDILAFLNEFASSSPGANLNNDTLWDFFDLQLFLLNLAAGCP